MSNSLLNEQIEYLKENKERICKDIYGKKIGFDLNLTYHFGSLAYFELNKIYTNVSREIYYSESLIADIFGDVMDSCCVQKGDEFSLKECMKSEAKMVILTDFVMKIVRNKEKYYPSEIKRKEKVLNNAHIRACRIIDTYFEGRDILFSEVENVFDHYEIIVSDQGNIVDFHFDRHGFSLNKEATSFEILEYVYKEKEKYQVALDHLQENKKILKEYEIRLVENGLLSQEQAEKLTTISIGAYELQNESEEKIMNKITQLKEGVESLFPFLRDLQVQNISLPKRTNILISDKEIKIDYFSYLYTKGSNEFVSQWANYLKLESFLEKVKEQIESNELRCFLTYKNNIVKVESCHKSKLARLDLNQEVDIENLNGMINREKRQKAVKLIFHSENGKLYRQTGEEILTPEVIQFEVMEKVREGDKEYFISVERAKQMLLSVLSPEEEKLMKTENLTIVEGQQNYYVLLNRTYNNVVKIPKNIKSTDEIKALCIHPAESSIPMYDGFASIVLSVKSGDEDYVLENSNEFTLQQKVKEKVLNVFNTFVPKQKINFA